MFDTIIDHLPIIGVTTVILSVLLGGMGIYAVMQVGYINLLGKVWFFQEREEALYYLYKNCKMAISKDTLWDRYLLDSVVDKADRKLGFLPYLPGFKDTRRAYAPVADRGALLYCLGSIMSSPYNFVVYSKGTLIGQYRGSAHTREQIISFAEVYNLELVMVPRGILKHDNTQNACRINFFANRPFLSLEGKAKMINWILTDKGIAEIYSRPNPTSIFENVTYHKFSKRGARYVLKGLDLHEIMSRSDECVYVREPTIEEFTDIKRGDDINGLLRQHNEAIMRRVLKRAMKNNDASDALVQVLHPNDSILVDEVLYQGGEFKLKEGGSNTHSFIILDEDSSTVALEGIKWN